MAYKYRYLTSLKVLAILQHEITTVKRFYLHCGYKTYNKFKDINLYI